MNATHYAVFQPTLIDNPRLTIPRFGIHEEMPPQMVNRAHGNDDYLLMFFHSPSSIAVDGQVSECASNTFILWEPGQAHHYGHPRRRWDHSWIHFGGSEVRRLVKANSLPRNKPFVLPDPHLVTRYLHAVHAEIVGHQRPDTVIIINLLHNWLREMERVLSGERAQAVPTELAEVKGYIEANYHLPMRLMDLAQRACLSVPRFCASFKSHFGYSAIDYLIRLRMQHAAFLLRDVNMRVKTVAESVGYGDLYYFSKLFRKHHGVSPRFYRRGTRGQRTSLRQP